MMHTNNWFTRCRAAIAVGFVAAAFSTVDAGTFTIVDGEGFESPDYTTTFLGTGQLEGQFASTSGGFGSTQWVQSPLAGTSTAVVQSSVVASGSQAVQVDRAANSNDRWAVPVTGYPGEQFVCIEWDMLVEATTAPTGAFGPFFGVEAYDDDAATIGLLGSLGVDATTGDVLFQDEDTGFFVETGEIVDFGVWNSFRIVLDYGSDEYSVFLNNDFLATVGFVDRGLGLDQFTDADISAIAAAGDPVSQGLTGTAYFDNFLVFETDANKVPEPAALALFALGLTGLVSVRGRDC